MKRKGRKEKIDLVNSFYISVTGIWEIVHTFLEIARLFFERLGGKTDNFILRGMIRNYCFVSIVS